MKIHVQARSRCCSGGNGESENKNTFCKLGMIPLIYKIILVPVCLCELFVCAWTWYVGIIFTESKHIFSIRLAAGDLFSGCHGVISRLMLGVAKKGVMMCSPN